MAKFTPFPLPVHPDDTPLITHAGPHYRCTGCGFEPIPDGMHIHETAKDGMVIGLRVVHGHDGPVIHECGQVGDI
jgi:hypothetical protein